MYQNNTPSLKILKIIKYKNLFAYYFIMKKRGTRAPAQQFIKNILPSQKRSQAFLITAVIFIAKTSDYVKKDGINIYFITEESGSLRCSKCDALDTSTNPINATIKENSYYFTKYPKGKHFYFIMIKEKGGEKYVYTNA